MATKHHVHRMLAQPTAPLYVERFCRGNIDGSRFSYEHLLRYNLASVLTLHHQGMISQPRARRLVGAILDLAKVGLDGIVLDPGLEDLQPNIERSIIERIGPDDGGDISLGHARFEFVYLGIYLSLREEILATQQKLLDTIEVLLDLSETHVDTLASYYTHHIRAEPITFGYYFSSFAEAFLAASGRLEESYRRYGVSPAGVGQVVPTSFPLDRTFLAELLGMDSIVRTSLYGYWNVDVLLDTLGVIALAGATMGRFASDLYWWSSSDLHLLTWGEEWTGGSFIMPQKRNPSWLKPVRQAAIDVATNNAKALNEYLNTAPMLLVGLIEVPGLTHNSLDSLCYGLDLLCGALPTARVNGERGRQQASSDFIQAAQIVHHLVKAQQASWRQAELLVGDFVREAIAEGRGADRLRAERLVELGRNQLGREIAFTQNDLANCLDPAKIVATRGDSGPAPDSVRASVRAQRADVAKRKEALATETKRIAEVWRTLDATARAL